LVAPVFTAQTLTATVAAAAGATPRAGSVTFYVAGAPSTVPVGSNGQASLTLDGHLVVGPHNVVAFFNAANGNYVGSYSGGYLSGFGVVGPSGTAAAPLNGAVAGRAVAGQSVTFIGVVGSVIPGGTVPTGNLVFYIDGVAQAVVPVNALGQAYYSLFNAQAGTHTLQVAYQGSSYFTTSSTAVSVFSVGKATPFPALSASTATPSFGQSTTLTMTVYGVVYGATPPGGVAYLLVDGAYRTTMALNSSGSGSFALGGLPGGTHYVQVIYPGDGNYAMASSSPLAIQVQPTPTGSSLFEAASTVTVGQLAGFITTAAPVTPGLGTPTGTVNYYVDGSYLASVPVDSTGRATLVTGGLSVGVHSVVAIYFGDIDFAASFTQTLSITVLDVGRRT
jgi:hypothetical protein